MVSFEQWYHKVQCIKDNYPESVVWESITLNSAYNEKNYAEIFLPYRQFFIKGDISIGEWEIFGAEVFLCYSQFFVRGNLVECIRSLKGAAADMAWYMGSTTSVAHILQKLSVNFGTVASFDVLMQNLYKVTQGNNEKVPSFAMRLEGTLI